MRGLKQRAERAGVGLTKTPCAQCGGKGHLLRPDGLDLERLRTKAGVSKYLFARNLGLSAGFISMVESGDRRCPESLLAAYLELETKAPQARHEVKARIVRDGTARLRKANTGRRPAPRPDIQPGQVWRKEVEAGDGSARVLQVEIVAFEGDSVILKRWDKPEKAAWPIGVKNFVKQYRNVTEEVRG